MSLILNSSEQHKLLELIGSLSTSLELRDVLTDAYHLLLGLVSADFGALAVSGSERPELYEWIVAGLPDQFFSRYAEMAPHDFVRNAVVVQPNVVLRDFQMVDRRALERNMMYHRAREVGAPLEHVMAVMLHVNVHLHSGLSLYRERRRPFSDRDHTLLQCLVPAIRNTVANCRVHAKVAKRGALLESLVEVEGLAAIVVAAEGLEIARSNAATVLLDRWFAPVERAGSGVPRVLLDELTVRARLPMHRRDDSTCWVRSGSDASLRVRFLPLPGYGRCWAVLLREVLHTPPLPARWQQRLTAREQEVASRVLRGWGNFVIAEDLGCTEATVKTHLWRIFNKLGLPSRAALLSAAAKEA